MSVKIVQKNPRSNTVEIVVFDEDVLINVTRRDDGTVVVDLVAGALALGGGWEVSRSELREGVTVTLGEKQ